MKKTLFILFMLVVTATMNIRAQQNDGQGCFTQP